LGSSRPPPVYISMKKHNKLSERERENTLPFARCRCWSCSPPPQNKLLLLGVDGH
jgi:hypothetical protein